MPAALAAAGACRRTLFRNPLVSHGILRASARAGLGAVLGIVLSLPAIRLMGFAGGLAAVVLVGLVAPAVRSGDRTLVLAGMVVGAAISLRKVLADPCDQLPAIAFRLLGSLTGIKTGAVLPALPVVLPGLVPIVLFRWRIDTLAPGDEEARALGVEAGRIRLLVTACAALVTTSVLAIAGVFGRVGPVIPHKALRIAGFGRLLPAAALPGAGAMLAVDTLARTVSATEVPLGILTAVVRAPVLLTGWPGNAGQVRDVDDRGAGDRPCPDGRCRRAVGPVSACSGRRSLP